MRTANYFSPPQGMTQNHATRRRVARRSILPAHARQAKPLHAPAREGLEHLLHLAVLLEQLVDVLDRRAAAAGDAPPATPVDEIGAVSYTHLRAHETVLDLVCRLL